MNFVFIDLVSGRMMATESTTSLMALQFASGSIAACGAVTITNPFDLLKTRRQLHNELGLFRTSLLGPVRRISLLGVWQAEGLKGLQKGLFAAYIYQILMNGTRFMVYEPTRLMLISKNNGKPNSLLYNATAGAIAGGLAAMIGSPFNLIKTRLQSYSPYYSTGYQYGYSSIGEAISQIWKSEGIAGFYRGASASIIRTTAGSAAQLSSYDWFKPLISSTFGIDSNKFIVHFGAAMTSGVLACLVMNPFDVVMTRLYNQKQGSLYGGLFDCAIKTVRAEGLTALWKGLVPHYIRIGPHTVLTLVLLEQIRAMLRPLLLST